LHFKNEKKFSFYLDGAIQEILESFNRETANTTPIVKAIGNAGGMAMVNKSNPRIIIASQVIPNRTNRTIIAANPVQAIFAKGFSF
jgi:hypothetical protein